MTPLDLAYALEDVRQELNGESVNPSDVKFCLLLLSERSDILGLIIKRLDLDMHASPSYVAKVKLPPLTGDQATALGILQGKGVRAQDVTSAHVVRAVRDYRARLDKERNRRIAAGIPLTGNLQTPSDLAPPASAFKPPWEQ